MNEQNDKPDLFEMSCMELMIAYRNLTDQGGFVWPTISKVLDQVLAATNLLNDAASHNKDIANRSV